MKKHTNLVRGARITRREFLKLSFVAGLIPFLADYEIFLPIVENENNGDGSLGNPYLLDTALRNEEGLILPGDEIVLRGGNYFRDQWLCNLAGTSDCPIRIRNYRNEVPLIFGEIVYSSESKFIEWQGVEMSDTSLQ